MPQITLSRQAGNVIVFQLHHRKPPKLAPVPAPSALPASVEIADAERCLAAVADSILGYLQAARTMRRRSLRNQQFAGCARVVSKWELQETAVLLQQAIETLTNSNE